MSRSPRLLLTASLLSLLPAVAGCGVEADSERFAESKVGSLNVPSGAEAPSEAWADEAAAIAGQRGETQSGATDPAADDARPAGVQPKIIYTADLTVVVDDFAAAETAIPALVEKFGGYIAGSNVDRSVGDRLRGTWTVRVPVANYNAFLSGAGGLGVVEERDESARDVTAEFVDVEARLAGRRALETRLLELLAERPGELKDVLEIERELARVREEIETAEGRLRYLSNQTAFSTITLNVREERDYVPPREPGFGERIATTWDNSLAALASFGRGLVLFVVAVAPFALVLGLPLVLLIWAIARRVRRRTA
ncbi:DUF4349 domain-containing protein [Alienimonas sp. DA493]|uniref:DUF4349 domain-containing protein n=1 Tax=Alienimonas sp. DA493 TaxID=3373605 RepID=UPI003754E74B